MLTEEARPPAPPAGASVASTVDRDQQFHDRVHADQPESRVHRNTPAPCNQGVGANIMPPTGMMLARRECRAARKSSAVRRARGSCGTSPSRCGTSAMRARKSAGRAAGSRSFSKVSFGCRLETTARAAILSPFAVTTPMARPLPIRISLTAAVRADLDAALGAGARDRLRDRAHAADRMAPGALFAVHLAKAMVQKHIGRAGRIGAGVSARRFRRSRGSP